MSPRRLAKALGILLLLPAGFLTKADDVVYEDSLLYSGQFNASALEFGDEVVLGGTARYLTQIQFEYYGDFTAHGGESARVRIYANTGPIWMGNKDYVMPAAQPLWEATIPLSPGFRTALIPIPFVHVPAETKDHLTWTVKFNGLSGNVGDRAGLLFYGVPSTGISYNDFWLLSPTGWAPVAVAGVFKNNFAAKILAAVDAPPPLQIQTSFQNGGLKLSWPSYYNGMTVEGKAAVTNLNWQVISATPTLNGSSYEVILPATAAGQTFRLTSQPLPTLEFSNANGALTVKWPATIGGFILQTRSGFDTNSWVSAPTPSRPTGAYYQVTLPMTNDVQFMRLVK